MNMRYKERIVTRHRAAGRNGLYLVLFVLLFAIATVSVAEVVPKSGHVITRGLVLGPNQKPIYSEIDASGNFINDIGEAVGPYEKARVISGDVYRGIYEHFTQHKQAHADDQAYRGAIVMTADDYKSTNLGSVKVPKVNWNGQGLPYTEVAIPKISLPDSVKSVLVRNRETIVDPDLLPPGDGSILFRGSIDLRPGYLRNLSDDIRSVLIGGKGEVLYTSSNNIGFKAAFYTDPEGNPNDSIRRDPKDTILGPVSWAKVEPSISYSMGPTYTDEEGRFSTNFYVVPCPGFSYDHHFYFESELAYRNYDPEAPSPIGTYYFKHDYYHFCFGYHLVAPSMTLGGLMAQVAAIGIHATMAIPYNPVDIYVDVVQLGGLGYLISSNGVVPIGDTTEYEYTPPPGNRTGPVNLDLDDDRYYDTVVGVGNDAIGVYLGGNQPTDENGQPVPPDLIRSTDSEVDWNHQGLLKNISEEDFKETDLYFYRASNGVLITKIEGLEPSGGPHLKPKKIKISREDNSFNYRVRIPGEMATKNTWSHYGTREEWQEALETPPELSGREFDALRPGEDIRIIAINRPTGYIGTQTVTIEAADQGVLDFPIPPLLMQPPNLKIQAERVYTVEAGLTKDEKREYTIGFEGSALTTDTMISIRTEWFDHDGTPLPEDLEGYTGRLAKVSSPNSVEGGEVQQFKIEPGKHLEVLKFRGDVLGTEHFYVHVSGYPEWRSAGEGAGDGPLRYRPKNYVPFLVPFLDETLTRELRNKARYAYEDGLSDSPEVDAVYHWLYRPEMQFSVFEFLIDELNVKTEFDETLGRTATKVDIDYQLNEARFSPLERFGALRQLLFELGYSELASEFGSSRQTTFEDILGLFARRPELAGRVSPEDFLTLQLADNADTENKLYELVYVPLLAASASPFTLTRSIQQGQFNPDQTNAGVEDITDSYKIFDFSVTQASKVKVTVLDHQRNEQDKLISEQQLVPGQYHFVLTYEEIEGLGILPRHGTDFYIQIEAQAVDQLNDSYIHKVEIPGDLRHTYRGEMLGQIIHHDIKIQNGSLILQREDFALKGRGPALELSRTYSNAGSGDEDSLLGEGWGYNWDISLRGLAYTDSDAYYHYIPNWVMGSRHRFLRPDELQPPSNELTLIAVSNGGLFKKQGGTWYAQRGRHGTLEDTGSGFVFTSKDGTQYEFQYPIGNKPMPLLAIEDRNGNRLTVEQEIYAGTLQAPLHRVTKVTDAVGRSMEFEYGLICGKHRLFGVTASGGAATAFHYDKDGLLTAAVRQPSSQAIDPCGEDAPASLPDPSGGAVEKYVYTPLVEDDDHNLTTVTDPNGHSMVYSFHTPGEIPASMGSFVQELKDEEVTKTVTYPGGDAAKFGYSFSGGNLRTVTDPRGNTTEYLLNYYGNPREIREPMGKLTKLTWTIDEGKNDNLITSRTDARNHTYTYEYDAKGNIIRETDPMGNQTVSVWNQKYSLLESRTDRNGTTITRTYNADNGNLLTSTDGDDFTTKFSYYGTGEVKTATDPRGNVTSYSYDSYGNPASVKNPETPAATTEYDIRGRLTSKSDPKGNTTTFTYDDIDRLIEQTDPDGRSTTYAYDAKGNKTLEINRYGLKLEYGYDPRDRMEIVTRSGLGIPTATQHFAYDGNSNVIQESDWKGQTTGHGYNALNQRTSTTDRAGHSMRMEYDLVDNKTLEQDFNGNIITFVYDPLERLIKTTRQGAPADRVAEQGYDNETNVLWSKVHNTSDDQLTQFAYNGRYLRTKLTNAEGGVASWEYDEAGNPIVETNAGSGRTEYEYDGENRKIEERRFHAASQYYTTTYDYDDNGNLELTTDPRGYDIVTEYDSLNRPLKITDQAGEITTYEYQDGGLAIVETDPKGITRTVHKDVLERDVSKTQGDGGIIRNQYDANDNLVQTTDAKGTASQVEYDAMDRPVALTEALGSSVARTSRKEYDPQGNVILEIDPDGNQTGYEYNAFNEPKKVTDPAPFNYTQVITYDQVGNKITEQDRSGNIVRYDYDRLNRVTTITGPAPYNYTQVYTYYPSGSVRTETDPRGHTATHYYDALDRLIRTEKPDGLGNTVQLVRKEYDGNDNVTRITDAEDNATVSTFTPRNSPHIITHADGNSITHGYDEVGNLETLQDENGKITQNSYDRENRLASVTNPAGETTSYTYDKNGNKTSVNQPLGLQWAYQYDELSRLKQVQDALGNTTAYQYDARDNLIQITDADGKVVTYGYDELSRRNRHTQIKDTGDLVVTYSYDPNGNRISTTDAKGRIFNYTYNVLNQLTASMYPAESGPYLVISRIDRTYDPNGNLDTITETKSGSGEVVDVTIHSYDYFDRLTSTTQRDVTISYGYDRNGNRTRVTSPAGETTYTFTPRNQVETAVTADGITQFEYYPDNRKQSVTQPNGIETRYSYDDAYRISTVVTSNTTDATVISQYAYSYDANGNRTEQQETQNGQLETTTYGYDAANRLATFTISKSDGSSETTTYTFDSVGNRLTEQKVDNNIAVLVDRAYTYDDTHWVTQITDNLQSASIDYTYDANGNTLQKVDNTQASPESTRFIYNSRDQLVQTQRGPPGNETEILGQYDYNYLGQRVRHLQSSRGDVNYYYDQDAVLEEQDENGDLLAHYRYADELISLTDGTNSQYYHQDALGSTTNLTRPDGTIQVNYRLDPWGHIREQVGASINRQIFTGQEHDTNTGLIYFGARYYDPDLGRFITQDTYLGEPGTPPSLHRYLYAYGNPLVYYDPNGNIAWLAKLRDKLNSWAEDTYDNIGKLDGSSLGERILGGLAGVGAGIAEMAAGGVSLVNYGANWASMATGGFGNEEWAMEHAQEISATHQTLKNVATVLGSEEGRAQIRQNISETYEAWKQGDMRAMGKITGFFGQLGTGAGIAGATAKTGATLTNLGRQVVSRTGKAAINTVRQTASQARQLMKQVPRLTGEAASTMKSAGRQALETGKSIAQKLRTNAASSRRILPGSPQAQRGAFNPNGDLFARASARTASNSSRVGEATVTLRYVEGMPKQQFMRKATALQELGEQGQLVRAANPVARNPAITRAYRQDMIRRIWAQYGERNREFANRLIERVTRRMQPDHVWELQLGGPDAASNLRFLDSFTNWHVGTRQIRPQIRDLPVGTRIRIHVEGPR